MVSRVAQSPIRVVYVSKFDLSPGMMECPLTKSSRLLLCSIKRVVEKIASNFAFAGYSSVWFDDSTYFAKLMPSPRVSSGGATGRQAPE